MDEKLKIRFHAHLMEMVSEASQVNPGMKEFYRKHGPREKVWKSLEAQETKKLQKKLDKLFPNEFRVEAGLISLTERSIHEKKAEEQAALRRQRLETHILASQKSTLIHFENHGSPTVRNPTKLGPLKRQSRGKECPTCGVKMQSKNELFGLTIEHIIPVRYGGKNTYDGEFPQCVGMCYLCNQTRNHIVNAIGREEIGNRTKISDRVIRFLITQVHRVDEVLDDQMSEMFWGHHRLASSQNIPVEDYDLFGDGEGEEYVEYQITPNEISTIPAPPLSEDGVQEDSEPIYLGLSKEQAIAYLKRDLNQAIGEANKSGKLYRSERLERLFLRHGSFEQFQQKIGMSGETIDAILYRLYPKQFIIETKGTVQFIYSLEQKEVHFYNFSADVVIPTPIENTPEEPEVKTPEVKTPESKPVSLPVLFARESMTALLNAYNHSRISLESITEALDDLRKEDGESWDAYLAKFGVKDGGTDAERIHMLLIECGFLCRLEREQQLHFIQFELPHSFE